LGDEEGIALGWIFRAHPAFGLRDDIKERLIAMMTKDDNEIKLAIFPKTIKYKIVKDGKAISTTGVTLKVAKTEGITSTEFRANMAEKWQHLDAKTGGSLFGKKFIPFGKEGDLGDDIMTAIILKQNRFLKNFKQHIIHNLNYIDEIVEIILADDVDMDMEASGVTVREVLYNHKDSKGAQQAKLSETVDMMLSSLNGLSDEMITIRKDMTQLSTTFREELSDFKWILLAQNGTKIASPRRKRVTRASSKEESSSADDVDFNIRSGSDSKDKGKTRNSAHRSKDSNSWDSMCETDMEGCNTMDEGDLTESVRNSTRRTLNPPPSPNGKNEVGGE
jgi:hypothetical protein